MLRVLAIHLQASLSFWRGQVRTEQQEKVNVGKAERIGV